MPAPPRALVVGSGPNGLAGAIALAKAGCSVTVHESQPTPGGGASSAELTLPGYLHDVGSAIHPFAIASPFFSTLPLERYGLEWIQPPAPLAHPLDDGTAVLLHRNLNETARGLGSDGEAWRKLFAPFTARWPRLRHDVLGTLGIPRHPLDMAILGWRSVLPASTLALSVFRGERARALFAGLAAHSTLRLDRLPTAAFGLIFGTAGQVGGWPLPRGGSQRITDALCAHLRSLGGEVICGSPVNGEMLSAALQDDYRAILCDVMPRNLEAMAGRHFPPSFRRRLRRFRHTMGIFKLDWALDGPIPWRARECLLAGTVHLGGTLDQLADAERTTVEGAIAEKPFVLLAQQSLFDATRAPAGHHTVWAYCHVPNGSRESMTERIENQIERFAPGFRDRVLARSISTPADLERRDANLIGGDVSGGTPDLLQMVFRPTGQLYSTPVPNLFLCSSATPPGAGVHGMCGYHAAQAALKRSRSI